MRVFRLLLAVLCGAFAGGPCSTAGAMGIAPSTPIKCLRPRPAGGAASVMKPGSPRVQVMRPVWPRQRIGRLFLDMGMQRPVGFDRASVGQDDPGILRLIRGGAPVRKGQGPERTSDFLLRHGAFLFQGDRAKAVGRSGNIHQVTRISIVKGEWAVFGTTCHFIGQLGNGSFAGRGARENRFSCRLTSARTHPVRSRPLPGRTPRREDPWAEKAWRRMPLHPPGPT